MGALFQKENGGRKTKRRLVFDGDGRIGRNVIHVSPSGPFGPSLTQPPPLGLSPRGQETSRSIRDDPGACDA